MITVLQHECPWLRYAPCWVWFRLLMTSLLSLRVLAWQWHVLHCSQRMRCAVQELRSEIIPQISSAVASIHTQLDGEWVNEWVSEWVVSVGSVKWMIAASVLSVYHSLCSSSTSSTLISGFPSVIITLTISLTHSRISITHLCMLCLKFGFLDF